MRTRIALFVVIALVGHQARAGSFTVSREVVIEGYRVVRTAHLVIVEDDGTTEQVITRAHELVTIGGPEDGRRVHVAEAITSRPSPLGLASHTEFAVDAATVEEVAPSVDVIEETVFYDSDLTPGDLTPASAIVPATLTFATPEQLIAATAVLWTPSVTVAENTMDAMVAEEEAAGQLIDEQTLAALSPLAGDPVRTATGQLEHVEAFYTIEVGQVRLPLQIVHHTGAPASGSFGPGWAFSLDARMTFGTAPGAASAVRLLETEATELSDQDGPVITAIDLATGTAVAEHGAIASELAGAIREAEALLVAIGAINPSGDLAAEIAARRDSMIRETQNVLASLRNEHARFASTSRRIEEVTVPQIWESHAAALDTVATLLASARSAALASAEAEAANARFVPPMATTDDSPIGPGQVIFTDEGGTPHRFTLHDGSVEEAGQSVLYRRPGTGYTIARPDMTLWDYGPSGELLRIRDLNDNQVSFIYDTREFLIEIRDSRGRTFALTRDDHGRVEELSGPETLTFSFTYEGAHLHEIVDPVGVATEFAYDSDRITSIIHSDGTARSYRYETIDSAARVLAVEDETGETESFAYPSPGVTEYADADGVLTRYHHDERLRLIRMDAAGESETWSYSPDGSLVTHTSRTGLVTETHRDDRERVLEVRFPDHTRTRTTYADDPSSDGIVIRAGASHVSERCDASGHCVRAEYDGRGNRTLQRYPDGTAERVEVVRPGRPAAGSPSVMIDRRGNRIEFAYDAYGYVERIVDLIGEVATYSYDALGRRVSVALPGQAAVVTEYRPDGLVSRITRDGHVLGAWEYSDRKDVIRQTVGGVTSISTYDASHRVLSYRLGTDAVRTFAYSAGGRVIRAAVVAASDPLSEREIILSYDEDGRLAQREWPSTVEQEWYEYDREGRLVGTVWTDGVAHRSSYDFAGRITRTGREPTAPGPPSRAPTQYQYEASAAIRIDPLGRQWRTESDPLRRMVREIDPEGIVSRTWIYDSYGELTAEIDGEGNTVAYERDFRGRAVRETYNGFERASYQYDEANQVRVEIDGDGRWVRHIYDEAGNRIRSEYEGGAAKEFSYDDGGRLAGATDETGRTTSFTYDSTGRLTAVSGPNPAHTWRTAYRPDGLPRSFTDATGATERYEYDGRGRLTAVTSPIGGVTRYAYNPRGNLIRTEGPTGRVAAYAFDEADRLLEIRTAGTTRWQNRYDDAGNLIESKDGNGRARTFAYDVAGRVTSETHGPETRRVAYDRAGRVIRVQEPDGRVAQFEYSDDGREHTVHYSAPYAAPAYTTVARDWSGRIVRAETEHSALRYEYDHRGALVQIDDGHFLSELTNDPAGRRQSASTAGHGMSTTTRYAYDESAAMTAVHSNSLGSFGIGTDAEGRIITVDYPNRMRLERNYNNDGTERSLLLRDDRGMQVAGSVHLYDDAGRRTHTQDDDSSARRFVYHPTGQLAAIDYSSGTGKREHDVRTALEVGIAPRTADASGPTLSAHERASLEHLARAEFDLRKAGAVAIEPLWRESLAYDEAGNRASWTTSEGTAESTFDANGRLVAVGSASYDRSVPGVITRTQPNGTMTTLQYDARGDLALVSQGDVTIRFYNDAFGRRFMEHSETHPENGLQKPTHNDGSVTQFHYPDLGTAPSAIATYSVGVPGHQFDLQKPVIEPGARYRSPGGTTILNRVAAEPEIAFHIAVGSTVVGSTAGGATFAAHDASGSVQHVFDRSGELAALSYDAFGSTLSEETALASRIPYRFHGRRADSVSGLQDTRARAYDPLLGRFDREDPLRYGTNWHEYPHSDPVNIVDPLGLAPASDRWATRAQPASVVEMVYAYIDETRRLSEKAALQAQIRTLSMYQPGAHGNYNRTDRNDLTWCNQAVFDYTAATSPALFAAATGGGANRQNLWGPTDPSYNTSANQAHENLATAARTGLTIRQIDGKEAQDMANIGFTVIAARPHPTGSGHMGVVAMSREGYTPAQGPTLSDVGQLSGAERSTFSAFGSTDGVEFFVDSGQDTGRIEHDQVNIRVRY